MIEVGRKKLVPATVRNSFGGMGIRTHTERIAATIIFVNRAHGFYVAEWNALGGKRRETFYIGVRKNGDNLSA